MDENGTDRRVGERRQRLRLIASIAPKADFLSQLIAEREHLPPQRTQRLVAPGAAVDAYRRGARIAVRRLPAGYRRTVLA